MAKLAEILTIGIAVFYGVSRPTFGQLKPDDRPELREAVTEAGNRLQKPACGALFGPKGRETFLSATYILVSFGKPKPSPDGKFSVMSASADRDRNVILINSEGPYLNPRLAVHGVQFNFGLRDREFRGAPSSS